MADVSKVNVNSTDYNIKDSNAMHKGVDYVTAGQASGTTLGYKATAEGRDVTASGNYSHAGGFNTSSSGDYSYADGASCYAEGTCARSEGANCLASGDYSYAQGEGSYAVSDHQHVQGKWNVPDDDGIYAHIIGCGTNNVNRKNIFTVDWNGVARDGTENRLLPFKAVSEAEYAALSQAEKTNGTAYFRYEATGVMREIQDNGSAASLISGALPTGQTIESYLNSNLSNVKIVYFAKVITIPDGQTTQQTVNVSVAEAVPNGYTLNGVLLMALGGYFLPYISNGNIGTYVFGVNISSKIISIVNKVTAWNNYEARFILFMSKN